MIHPSATQFALAMTFSGTSPCQEDSRYEVPGDSGISTEVETLALLFGFVRALRPKVVVETGCNVGCASRAILSALQANRQHAVVSTCDTDLACVLAVRQIAEIMVEVSQPGEPVICLLCFQGTGLEALTRRPNADLYFLDSSEQSRVEEMRWLKVHGKNGAVVLVHDVCFPGIGDALRAEVATFANHVILPGPRGLGVITL